MLPQGFSLLQDFAVIMVVAGATAVLFRLLRQPPILGYLVAGIIVGPHTPLPVVQDVETIRQLADLGVVLLMFGLGLEFSLDRLRPVGLVALVAGSLGMLFMLVTGYEMGLLLGWGSGDALFLGAAVSISSTMVIVKVLADQGRLRQEASRILVGILVLQDFAAVAMIALFSGVATTGAADLGSALMLLGKLSLFALGSVALGSLAVPRLLELVHRFQSREAMLVTGLALCFALALLSQRAGLSVAAGAFLMGSIIASSRHAEEVLHLVAPLRDIFAALFFVAIGMLLDVGALAPLLLPALALLPLVVVGRAVASALGTLVSGYSARTALRVGLGLAPIGEFSLVIAKVGLDQGAVGAMVYPVIVVLTGLTTLMAPYLMRLSDPASERLDRVLPRPVRDYLAYGGLLQRAFRRSLKEPDPLARASRHHLTLIFLNVLVIAILWGAAALTFHLAAELLVALPLSADLLGLLLALTVLVLSLPSLVIIWGNLRALVHTGVEELLRRQTTARFLGRKVVGRVLRDTVLAFILIGVAIPALPLATRLVKEGSFWLLALPLAAALTTGYLFWDAIHQVHCRLEAALHRTLLGEAPPADPPQGEEGGKPPSQAG